MDLLFLIDKHEVVWYTKYTKSNREKEPYSERKSLILKLFIREV